MTEVNDASTSGEAKHPAPQGAWRGLFKIYLPLLGILVLVLLMLFTGPFFFWRGSTRVIVRNSGKSPVEDVVLVLRHVSTGWSLTKNIPTLGPGEEVAVKDVKLDMGAELKYTLDGTEHEHRSGYIDLWAGETWIFDVQADGTVRSGYYYPHTETSDSEGSIIELKREK